MAADPLWMTALTQLSTLCLFVLLGAVANRLLPTPMVNGASLYSWLLGIALLAMLLMHVAEPKVSNAQAAAGFLLMGAIFVLARWWARRIARQLSNAGLSHG